MQFPPSYRTFLLELGAGDFDGEEVAGVIGADFMPRWPDAIGTYLKELKSGLPPRYLPVYLWGDGTASALDLDRRDESGECPVVACHDGLFRAAPIEDEASSFGVFLLARVRSVLT